MYKHILVPTDGSTLATDAVRKAVDFARAIGAKITFFHAKPDFPIAPYSSGGLMESISPARFAEMTESQARQILRGRRGNCPDRGRRLRIPIGNQRFAIPGHHRYGDENGLRPHLHGLPRSPRRRRQAARERDREGTDTFKNPRAGLSLRPSRASDGWGSRPG